MRAADCCLRAVDFRAGFAGQETIKEKEMETTQGIIARHSSFYLFLYLWTDASKYRSW